ncbi:response regulator receiver domain protein [Rhodoferax ferrireducens T118]|uniref:Response regulator receiver domain protein n=1 Tax=Albidiferax ferrireducens (strain ATCC BAA-621 / DSM 15236 / T118) TaxID=338969 RepID=Q21SH6_ALBFT|nr:response regulator [Rhodoferax ferrireducens]ABD71277.1 response regulator receiver domain protein [Rhodoferax ferrireducens T118]
MTQTILVIDDDAAVRGSFQLVLGEIGCVVRVAEDGLQGIAMAREERPDLIFLDLKMPGIDGVETMRRLLAMDPTFNIYIVTAFSQEYLDDLKQAQAEGMTFQLANKPLSSTQIRHIARSVRSLSNVSKDNHRISLTLYVVSVNPEIQKVVDQLSNVLAATYRAGFWVLNVVEVLGMPEKALEKDVFATPMLVREVPEPVLKLLGDLSRMHSVLSAITAENGHGAGTVVL